MPDKAVENARREYEKRTDLDHYGTRKFAVFVGDLFIQPADLGAFADTSVTDGNDDKKTDICHIDLSQQYALVAQVKHSMEWGAKTASANKAADLNTAINWLLRAEMKNVPERLQRGARELRDGIASGEIAQLVVAFIHNCQSSHNVKIELETVQSAASGHVQLLAPTIAGSIQVIAKEYCIDQIVQELEARSDQIRVRDQITVPIAGRGVIEQGTGSWKSLVISVPGRKLADLYLQYGDALFSANFRDYLPPVRSKESINRAIVDTARDEPENFWVYNNGITILTRRFLIAESASEGHVELDGISVINGAQTTGSLGRLDLLSQNESLSVLCRIVECDDSEVVDRIVQFNNTQNEILPHDRRSKEGRLKRLSQRFRDEYGISFVSRRSGATGAGESIRIEAVGPILCAFHGDPQTAHRNAKAVFQDDIKFEETFPLSLAPEHIQLVWCLNKAIGNIKMNLSERIKSDQATIVEREEYEVLRYAASRFFMLYVVGRVSEQLVQRPLSDLHHWKCKSEAMRQESRKVVGAWESTLVAILPFVVQSIRTHIQDEKTVYDVVRDRHASEAVAITLQNLIAGLRSVLSQQFEALLEVTLIV